MKHAKTMKGHIVDWPNWIAVIADDLERQRRFYRDVLELKEISVFDKAIWFDMGWPKSASELESP